MKRNTKTKGDCGVGHVIADLLDHGYNICLPISDHLPFDIIAVDQECNTRRIEVKYRQQTNGKVAVNFRTVYSNKRGTHFKESNLDFFDAYAIYCPDTGKIYYVLTDEVRNQKSITLRTKEPVSSMGVQKTIRWASQFEDCSCLFGEVSESGLRCSPAKGVGD